MNSSEEIGSAEETHDFDVQEGDRWGGDPSCLHEAEELKGEGREWDEVAEVTRVSHLYRCTSCSSERLVQDGEI